MATNDIREIVDFEIYKHQELVSGMYRHLPWKNIFESQKSSYYMVIFSGKNGAEHYIDDQLIKIHPYSVLFIGPDRKSKFTKEAHESTHILVFSHLFYNRTTRDAHALGNNPLFHNFHEVYQLTPPDEGIIYCKSLAWLLHNAKENPNTGLSLDLGHNIIEQILLMGAIYAEKDLDSCFESNPDQTIVMDFRKALAEHYQNETTVKFYAEKLHITERRLSKATTKILHQTAKEVIMEHIMNEARWRLANRPDSIKEISHELGFSGEHNFSAFFKKNENLSPLHFRKKHQITPANKAS